MKVEFYVFQNAIYSFIQILKFPGFKVTFNFFLPPIQNWLGEKMKWLETVVVYNNYSFHKNYKFINIQAQSDTPIDKTPVIPYLVKNVTSNGNQSLIRKNNEI